MTGLKPRRLAELASRPALFAAGVCLLGMTLLTVVDVAGRYLFNSPLNGGVEVTEFMMVATVFLALPVVTARNEHIDLDVFEFLYPGWLKRAVQVVSNLAGAVAMSFVAWRVAELAARSLKQNDTTIALEIPVYGLVYFISAMCALTAFMFAVRAVLWLRPGELPGGTER
jgi:TRAP-type C4-dicarboxylate transport system permease small subunit